MIAYLGVLDGRVLPRLWDVSVVPEDGAVVKPQLALLRVLENEQQTPYRSRA